MKITTLSSLAAATVMMTLGAGAIAAHAATGCAASKAFSGLTNLTHPAEGNPMGLGQTPDSQALAHALGSFGIAAGLVAGGTLLYRKRREETALADGSRPATELEFATQSETVLVSDAVGETVETSTAARETPLSPSR